MTVKSKAPGDTTIAVAGSTGYIGKFVAMECVRRGYKTIALTRKPNALPIEGAEMVVADVTDPSSIEAALAGHKVCLSRVGAHLASTARGRVGDGGGAWWGVEEKIRRQNNCTRYK